MARSFKFKNDMYLDTKGIVHNKILLSELLSQNPIGEFVLWEGNKLITNNNTYQYIATYYSIIANLEKKFPIKIGLKRRYKLVLEYTDNKTSGDVYIRFTAPNAIDLNVQERLFENVYGVIADGTRYLGILEAPDFSIYTNHVDIYCTPDFATGGQVRIYKLYLLVYDELE